MTNFKAGIIGAGRIGLQLEFTDKLRPKPCTHYGMLTSHPDIDLVAIVEPNEVGHVGEKGIPYVSVDAMLLNEKHFDILTVATPTPTHYEVGMKVAKRTRLLFMEKPMTETLEEAKKLIAKCKKHGTILVVNHTRRWHPLWCKAQIVLPKPRLLLGKFCGEWLHDGIHMFDIVNWFSPQSFKLINFDDYNIPALSFEAEIYGAKSAVRVTDFTLQIGHIQDSKNYQGYKEYNWTDAATLRSLNPWYHIATDLVNTLKGKQEPTCTGHDGLRALNLALTHIGR